MKNEMIVFEEEGIRLEVNMKDETVWLTQAQMAELFKTTVRNIGIHAQNIFKEKELHENSVKKDFFLTASDGKEYRTKFYNLDMIISVGYKVNSKKGIKFRQWATKVLKEYLELNENSTRKDFFLVTPDSKEYRTKFYNLDIILNFLSKEEK